MNYFYNINVIEVKIKIFSLNDLKFIKIESGKMNKNISNYSDTIFSINGKDDETMQSIPEKEKIVDQIHNRLSGDVSKSEFIKSESGKTKNQDKVFKQIIK